MRANKTLRGKVCRALQERGGGDRRAFICKPRSLATQELVLYLLYTGVPRQD